MGPQNYPELWLCTRPELGGRCAQWCKAQRCPVSLALPLVLTGVGEGGASRGGCHWALGRVGISMATAYGHLESMSLARVGMSNVYGHRASMRLGRVGMPDPVATGHWAG